MSTKILSKKMYTNRELNMLKASSGNKKLLPNNPKTLFLRNLQTMFIRFGMTKEEFKKYSEQFEPDIFEMLKEFESDILNNTSLLKDRYIEDAVFTLRGYQRMICNNCTESMNLIF